jgi:saccharopine dehydrogenase-like NADP-dependent oxidoreductase
MAVLDAVVRSGGMYIDIDDDPEPTLNALARHEEAAATGATCVMGLGGSPRVTNLLATLTAGDLDPVREIVTAWNVAGAGPADAHDDPVGAHGGSSAAAREHFFRETTGSVLQLRHGAIVRVEPMQPITLELRAGEPIPASQSEYWNGEAGASTGRALEAFRRGADAHRLSSMADGCGSWVCGGVGQLV